MSAKNFDPAELLQVLMDIARAGSRAHITSEYRRCVDGSCVGSSATTYSQLPTPQYSLTGPSTPPTGTSGSVKNIEDTWWIDQDADEGWSRQWEGDTDSSDPKHYK